MQNIIKTLLLNPENYFWSKSDEKPGKIILGGHDAGRNLGEFEFELNDQFITIDRSITNGVSSGQMLSPLTYSNRTSEYKELKEILEKVEILLLDSIYLNDREFNRSELLLNTFNLLPKYSGELI